ERVYTVPLTRAWITARHKRTKRAVKVLREFAERHMKSSEIKIDTDLNEKLWYRGITKPPRRITVKMEKDEDGVVTISPPKEEKTVETTAESVLEAKETKANKEVVPSDSDKKTEEAPKAAKRKTKPISKD
ncbi:MAG: 50S ribosomal protein L31e, partial [Nitrososphaerota archaeon]|nr:50S ribosomal protein L31e [Nitrososphaerota archaeon]